MRDSRPDLSLASTGGRTPFLTYEPYYGLKEKPFSLSSDPRFLYKSRGHASVYDDLRAGIRRREGLVVLTGDIGTGKTTLCRSVLKDLDRKTFSTFVPDPFVSREDLLKMLLIDFGVMSVDDLRSGRLSGASRPDLSYPLYEFLNTLVPLQAFAVLVVDEAQNLSLSLLEEIRILSDLEGPEKLLQVVLIGQLELLPKLKDPQLRQVDQRVTVRCELQPLDRDGVAGYIAHRLAIAGGGSDRVSFAEDAVDLIYSSTNGNPRLINIVCDKALYHGHLTRTFSIGSDLITKSLFELGVGNLTPAVLPVGDFGLESFPAEGSRGATADPPRVEAPALNDAVSTPAAPFRGIRWITAAVLVVAVAVSVTFVAFSQARQELAEPLTLPAPPAAPLRVFSPETPPAERPGGTNAPASAQSFEVGVALFAGPTRATRLQEQLAAAGYRASVRPLELANGPMYEVRTGPYPYFEAAHLDAVRIREEAGFADARIISLAGAPR